MYYIIKNIDTNKYIGMDENSGGYAYETDDILRAYITDNLEDITKYKNVCNNYNYVIKVLEIREMNVEYIDKFERMHKFVSDDDKFKIKELYDSGDRISAIKYFYYKYKNEEWGLIDAKKYVETYYGE